MKNQQTYVKDPYVKTHFATEQDLQDFIACCDPKTGYAYFMSHFFYIQHPTRGSMLYQPWDYQVELAENYHNYRYSVNLLSRQLGKCFVGETMINIKNNKTGEIYDIPADKFYEYQEAKRNNKPLPEIACYKRKDL